MASWGDGLVGLVGIPIPHRACQDSRSQGNRIGVQDTILIALKPGVSLGEQQTLGRISIQTLEGRVRLKLPAEDVELPRGALLALAPSLRHDVEAVEQSAILLTISWPS